MNNLVTKARTASVVLGASVAAAAVLAPGANAAYVGATPACQGATITGGGASFQRALQVGLGADIVTGWTAGTPFGSLSTTNPAATDGFGFPYTGTGSAPATNCTNFRADGKKVRYTSIGSSGGRNSWAANGNPASRDVTAAFVGTDEPLDPTEEANVETVGLSSTGSQVESFPVAQGAVAIMANFPDGCQMAGVSGYRQATLTNLEAVFYGSKSKWGHLMASNALVPTPETTDTPRATGTSDPTSCAQQPVERVVRLDGSGTTFAFKKVLDENHAHTTSGPGRWSSGATDYLAPGNNTVWPATVSNPASTGGGAVASYVGTHPGSVGYADLATARSAGFDFDNSVSDKKVWLSLTVPASDEATSGKPTYTNDPSKDPMSQAYRNTQSAPFNVVRKGANCSAAPASGGTSDRDYLDLLGASAPDGTNDNWFEVTGARPSYRKYDYPICSLTYVLAYQKYSRVPGFPEPQARSVFDYVRYLVSTDAQKRLLALDYQGLPDAGAHPLRPIASAGVGRISFN